MEDIIDIIIKLVAALLALGIAWGGRYLVAFIKSKLTASEAEKLDLFVSELVAAAEQQFKEQDPDGLIRFDYVQEMLVKAGYEITDAIKALIEAKVYDINVTNKLAKAGESNELA